MRRSSGLVEIQFSIVDFAQLYHIVHVGQVITNLKSRYLPLSLTLNDPVADVVDPQTRDSEPKLIVCYWVLQVIICVGNHLLKVISSWPDVSGKIARAGALAASTKKDSIT